jgi:hypothetical protein
MTEDALDQTLARGEGQHHQEDEDGRHPTQGPQYLYIVLGTSLFVLLTSWGVPDPCQRTFTTFYV